MEILQQAQTIHAKAAVWPLVTVAPNMNKENKTKK
jgi:hypothetical protein